MTGHHHAVRGTAVMDPPEVKEGEPIVPPAEDIELYEDPNTGVLYLRVKGEQAVVEHDEHASIVLPQGDYVVSRQREYSPERELQVLD